MDRLNEWFKPFADIKRLSFKEAKEIINQAKNTDNEDRKKQLYNEVILGTMYVIYDYIKDNKLYEIYDQDFDIDDLISSFTRQWITTIHDVNFNSILSFNTAFKRVNFQVKSLVGVENDSNSDTKYLRTDKIFDYELLNEVFKDYIEIIKIREFTINDVRNFYKVFRDYDDETINALIEAFDYLYFNGWDAELHTKDSLSMIDYNIIINRINRQKSQTISIFDQEIELNSSPLDKVLDDILYDVVVDDLMKILTPRERYIVKQCYFFDGNQPNSMEEIGKKLNTSRKNISLVLHKALNKMYNYLIAHMGPNDSIYDKYIRGYRITLTDYELLKEKSANYDITYGELLTLYKMRPMPTDDYFKYFVPKYEYERFQRRIRNFLLKLKQDEFMLEDYFPPKQTPKHTPSHRQ